MESVFSMANCRQGAGRNADWPDFGGLRFTPGQLSYMLLETLHDAKSQLRSLGVKVFDGIIDWS